MDMICKLALTSWAKLNPLVGVLTEEQLRAMLEWEKENSRRLNMMIRIQQRLNAIESERNIRRLKEEFGSVAG